MLASAFLKVAGIFSESKVGLSTQRAEEKSEQTLFLSFTAIRVRLQFGTLHTATICSRD